MELGDGGISILQEIVCLLPGHTLQWRRAQLEGWNGWGGGEGGNKGEVSCEECSQSQRQLSTYAPGAMLLGTSTVSSIEKAWVSMPGTGLGNGRMGVRPSGVPG